MPLRLYLTGRICIEAERGIVDERRFFSRQVRRLFAYLAVERGHPIPRSELADAIWGEASPEGWDNALSALLSRLRSLLAGIDEPGRCGVTSSFGCHELRLPYDTWIDVEAAGHALDQAEGLVRAGALPQAWGPANVVAIIARRPLLPGEEGAWIEQRRSALRVLLLRALDCLTRVCLANGEPALAVQHAAESVTLEPFRESGYQQLMRAHTASGDRAEALRVYERCRRLLAEELGADPSPQTQALYMELLGAS